MNQRLFNAAMKYINAGIAAIPVWPDRRKNPKLSSYLEYRERLPTQDEWSTWAHKWPTANIALLTGYHAGLCALDFDSILDYSTWRMAVNDKWVNTWTVETGRGKHVYFFAQGEPGNDRTYTHKNITSVLLRAKGAYIIAPPSIHHTGKPYKTIINTPPIRSRVGYILSGWDEKNQPTNGGHPAPPRQWGAKLDITDWIQPYHSNPNSRGAMQCFCPFHDDNNPSAWVNREQNRFGCNNPSCPGYGWHDVINVIALFTGYSNVDLMRNYRTRGNPLNFG